VGTDKVSQPFDEQAALRALEQLRGQIQDARARREQKLAEFDAFVRSSRSASHAERLAALGEPALERGHPAVQTAARTAERARDPGLPARSELISRTGVQQATRLEPVHPSYIPEPHPDPFAEPFPAWRRIPPRALGAAAIVILIVAVFAFSRAWRGGGEEPADGAVPPSTASTAATGAVPAANAPRGAAVRPPAPVRAVQIELTTMRPVWMRVTADGERRLEREVPGGQKLSFGADRAIVLRAGDGGAVRLSVNGSDRGMLGRAGYPVTRTVTRER
jgi:cytoskeleton protein RodZ